MNKLKILISKYCFNSLDSEEIKFAKSLILIISICCSFCGLAWSSIYYFFFGFGLTTVLPLIFVFIVVSSIFLSHFISNYKVLVYAQLACITWVTAFIQWSLGSIHDSGFVIAWCFLGPIGALLFLNEKDARIWMVMFVLILGITSIGVPTFSMDGAKVTENARTIFYLMNIGVPSTVIFSATTYFLKNLIKQKERNFTLLQITKEKNKEIEKSLRKEKELGQLKTRIVSTVSHQFRTPLAVIQSNTELLEMLTSTGIKQDPEKYKKVTHRITEGISKMTDLMDEVLILGKINSGNIQYIPENLDLVEFLKPLINQFNSIQRDGRMIDFEIEGEANSVYLDTKLLSHALENLISNAFKYSQGKKNPKLIVSFGLKELKMTIKDYGIGIPKAEVPNLFQPFFRANNAAEIKGTGLGLSIAKEYVEMNKGILTLNTTEGIGSSFEIKIQKYTL